MIDTHCHVDLHDNPLEVIASFESNQMECVSITMLPSHYRQGLPHLRRHACIYPSLGLHPLRVKEGKRELPDFIKLARTADYIGEIGLDFSREGGSSKDFQIEVLAEILPAINDGKFVSVHSREAVRELLQMLSEAQVAPVCFHYFTGGPTLARDVIQAGHYLSFNHRMLNGRHKALLDIVPRDRLLLESDAPFLSTTPAVAIRNAYAVVAEHWKLSFADINELISRNFRNCRTVS